MALGRSGSTDISTKLGRGGQPGQAARLQGACAPEKADTTAELAALGSALLEADCPDDTSDFAYGCNESGSVCILVLGDGGNCERYCDPYGCTWICT